MSRRKTILLIITSVLIVALTGLTRIATVEPYAIHIYVVLVILAVVKECVSAMSGKVIRTAGSNRFYKFFSDWYGHDGNLVICCRGLGWLNGKILQALVNRDERFSITLYFADEQENLTDLKIRLGSRLIPHKVDSLLVSRFTFSKLITTNDTADMYIIRYKSEEKSSNAAKSRQQLIIHNTDDVREKALIDNTIQLLERV